jgi:hypothetical protein
MKKAVKQLISAALASVLVVGGVTVLQPVDVKAAEDYTAFLMFADKDWAFGNFDSTLESATTTISGDGTYTVTLNAADVDGDASVGANGAQVFCVDIEGAQAGLTEEGKTFSVTDLSVTADGEEVAVDADKIVTGDIEENGNFRIEIYNDYGDTVSDAPIDAEGFTFKDNITVEFTLETVDYEAPEAADEAATEEAAVGEIDLDGTYHAYLGLQTPNWTYRNAWNDSNGMDSEYWGQYIYGNETGETYGTVTDAVIEGNGTYTVSITDFGSIIADDFETAGQDHFNLLFISTDIPLSDSIKVTDVTLKIDGKTITTYADAFLDPDATDYVKILIQNIWNEDVSEIPYYNAPSDSVEMSFTISGFNYDNTSAVVTDAEATEVPAGAAVEESSGVNGTAVAVVVVVIVAAAIAVVAVVVSKKKKAEN